MSQNNSEIVFFKENWQDVSFTMKAFQGKRHSLRIEIWFIFVFLSQWDFSGFFACAVRSQWMQETCLWSGRDNCQIVTFCAVFSKSSFIKKGLFLSGGINPFMYTHKIHVKTCGDANMKAICMYLLFLLNYSTQIHTI